MSEATDKPLGAPSPQAGRAIIDREACLGMTMQCADFNLRRATRRVSQAFDQALKPTGLKITQFSLLVACHLNENLVLSKLARVMGMDRTTLSRNLALLEKRGLVALERGDDRREVRAQLTPAGLAALDQAAPLWHQAQERIVAGVGDGKWQAMLADLRQLIRGLR
ncbi:MAG: MarR family winged helix-turn-helix transcriptional regulator [Thermodesulfobacteriota bacterium]